MNGDLVAWTNGTDFTAKDGDSYLYLGWDEDSGPSAGHFKGIVDEFRLYKTALSPDAVKGLMWFLHGANSVVVPRGVFYGSKLFAAMNGSWNPNSPLSNATIHGNDNNLSSSLNARVIQMVITKNATLAQAWGILGLALTNWRFAEAPTGQDASPPRSRPAPADTFNIRPGHCART